jgi:hypothetical protein
MARKHLITTNTEKKWSEMTDDEKTVWVNTVFASMKQKADLGDQ